MPTYTYADMARFYREDGGKGVARAVEVIRKTVKLHGPQLVQEEIQSLTPRMPVDRGTYRRSFKVDDIDDGAVIYNHAPHAGIIEWGRRPGRMPPVSMIKAWLLRKKIVSAKGRNADAEASRAAYLVARSIAKRGLPARHVLALACKRLDPIVRAALLKEVS